MTADAQAWWVVDLPAGMAARAAQLRGIPQLEVAAVNDRLWLKVPVGDDRLLRQLQAVADAPVLKTRGPDQLVPVHGAVPIGRLPQTAWMAASAFFEPQLPIAGIPGGAIARLRLHLVRSTHERPAELLLCDAAAFVDWVITAPETRLQKCRYALCSDATPQVLVHAQQLPPLAGQLFWLAGQVGIPLGFEWSPNVDCETLNAALLGNPPATKTQQAFAIWMNPGDAGSGKAGATAAIQQVSDCVHVIAASSLIRTTRSSVRSMPFSGTAEH